MPPSSQPLPRGSLQHGDYSFEEFNGEDAIRLPRRAQAAHDAVEQQVFNDFDFGLAELLGIDAFGSPLQAQQRRREDGFGAEQRVHPYGFDGAADSHGDLTFPSQSDDSSFAGFEEEDAFDRQTKRRKMDSGVSTAATSILQTPVLSQDPVSSTKRDEFFDRVLEVFPDIEHAFINGMYDTFPPSSDMTEEAITQILEAGSYPKERQAREERRRKSEAEQAERRKSEAEKPPPALLLLQKLEMDRRQTYSHLYREDIKRCLLVNFPTIPVTFIQDTRHANTSLKDCWLALLKAENSVTKGASLYVPLRAKRRQQHQWKSPPEVVELLKKEMADAQETGQQLGITRQCQKDAEMAAEMTRKEYQQAGMMIECQCCFDNFPLPDTTYCNGDDCHFFCLSCAKAYAESQIGISKYQLLCMDTGGCTGEFHGTEVKRFLDAKSVELLAKLKLNEELRLAELPGFTRCPFCDFGALCDDVEVDKEFRCGNTECGIVSCRLCQGETHIPLSCKEFRESKDGARHTVEEAMSESMIRKCNDCQTSFIKSDGCNKMTCPKCKSLQCYVCRETITKQGYSHFSDNKYGGKGKCALWQDSSALHKTEVEKAVEEAKQKLKAKNPGIQDEELNVELPDFTGDAKKATVNAARFIYPVPRNANADNAAGNANNFVNAADAALEIPRFGELHDNLWVPPNRMVVDAARAGPPAPNNLVFVPKPRHQNARPRNRRPVIRDVNRGGAVVVPYDPPHYQAQYGTGVALPPGLADTTGAHNIVQPNNQHGPDPAFNQVAMRVPRGVTTPVIPQSAFPNQVAPQTYAHPLNQAAEASDSTLDPEHYLRRARTVSRARNVARAQPPNPQLERFPWEQREVINRSLGNNAWSLNGLTATEPNPLAKGMQWDQENDDHRQRYPWPENLPKADTSGYNAPRTFQNIPVAAVNLPAANNTQSRPFVRPDSPAPVPFQRPAPSNSQEQNRRRSTIRSAHKDPDNIIIIDD